MNTVELDVQGMTCGSCVKHVTKALQSVPGVSQVEVDLAKGRARVMGEVAPSAQALIAALASEDYSAQLASTTGGAAAAPKADGGHTAQGGKSGCCCS
jgi:copper chaperone